jgi:hypothetical protein
MAVEWSEVTSTDWENQLGQLVWQAERSSDGRVSAYFLVADCPRCEEPGIDLRHPTQIIRADLAPVRVEMYVQCECSGEHLGRPADETGCGSRTSMVFTIPTGAGKS